MTRPAAARDIAWLRANPGLGIELFDLLNHRPTPHPGGPTRHHVWDPRRPGWRIVDLTASGHLALPTGSSKPTGPRAWRPSAMGPHHLVRRLVGLPLIVTDPTPETPPQGGVGHP